VLGFFSLKIFYDKSLKFITLCNNLKEILEPFLCRIRCTFCTGLAHVTSRSRPPIAVPDVVIRWGPTEGWSLNTIIDLCVLLVLQLNFEKLTIQLEGILGVLPSTLFFNLMMLLLIRPPDSCTILGRFPEKADRYWGNFPGKA
jgi:hypothetical protein